MKLIKAFMVVNSFKKINYRFTFLLLLENQSKEHKSISSKTN